ncbi:MAG: hypothetical protein COT85_04515 [Chlamydiae bacterium CG10_big_fil_rev_8_21_14_0_10_42_34]|nr:MAG: hypothetical protein COT85_04515 [Chlamydiae bacterium CG10_big_fil_rev_8_21_14_0_10_42_34]
MKNKAEDPIQYIQNLDLQYIVKRLVGKKNWDEAEAKDTVRKYKNFLALKILDPKLVRVPTLEIDEVWHDHILHTRKYMQDCDRIFGKYMHHEPSSGTKEEEEHLADLYVETMRSYEEKFQESYGHALDISKWCTNKGKL